MATTLVEFGQKLIGLVGVVGIIGSSSCSCSV